MKQRICTVCESPVGEPIYESPGEISITSLAELNSGKTEVFICPECEHVQTTALPEIDEYYDKAYNILVESEEEDHIYEYDDNDPIYRNDHQLNVLLEKLSIADGARVLDYGCAKGATLRGLKSRRPNIDGYLFDVSERYLPFWKNLVPDGNWSTYAPATEWRESFDAVVSMFALEHVAHPVEMLSTVRELLTRNGQFFFIVPNVLTNICDLIVVDHVNHFTVGSLNVAMRRAGLRPIDIDDKAFRGAWVVLAERDDADASGEINGYEAYSADKIEPIAGFWRNAAGAIAEFESRQLKNQAAIFGCGFYGSYLFTTLEHPDRVTCFVDNNPYLQGTEHLGRPVIAPEDLDSDVQTIYVGLNPEIARKVVSETTAWSERRHECFFF